MPKLFVRFSRWKGKDDSRQRERLEPDNFSRGQGAGLEPDKLFLASKLKASVVGQSAGHDRKFPLRKHNLE